MIGRPRHVFDTNTVVSALLFRHSRPGEALLRALQRGEILLSTTTLEELADVLDRDKFDRYLTGSDREEFLVAFVERAIFVEPTEEIRVCRDARDNKFLELAVNGSADCIITEIATCCH
jgi:putative PIN family toxin of toxin-antitoxin system